MGVANPSPLNAEQIDVWRRNIRDATNANYYLSMGVAIHHQGAPGQALPFLRQGLACPVCRDEMEVALADALSAAGDPAEADRVLAAARERDPAAELKGRMALLQIYKATTVVKPDSVLALVDQALELARAMGEKDSEKALLLRRLTLQLQARTVDDPNAALRSIIARNAAGFEHAAASAEALADLIREVAVHPTPLSPVSVFEAYAGLLRLAARTPPSKQPDLTGIDKQLEAALRDSDVMARIPELIELARPLLADNLSARDFLHNLGNSIFHNYHNFAISADIFLCLLEHNPQDASIRLRAGRCLAFIGQEDLAAEYICRASRESLPPALLAESAFTLLALGHIDEAADIAAAAADKYPEELAPRLALGIVRQAMLKDDDAEEIAKSLCAAAPENASVLIFHAIQLFVMGRVKAALHDFETAVKAQAVVNPYLLFWKGLFMVHAGDADQGRAMVLKQVSLLGMSSLRLHIRTFPRVFTILHKELKELALTE